MKNKVSVLRDAVIPSDRNVIKSRLKTNENTKISAQNFNECRI
jgi:hypothetical protein